MAPMSDLFDLLPDSIITTIFSKLRVDNLARCELVCKRWSMLCKRVDNLSLSDHDDEDIVWRFLFFNRNIQKLDIVALDKTNPKIKWFSCWISLVRHSLQYLTVISHMFLPSVISCHKLVIVRFEYCRIGEVFFGLPCLRTCQFVDVHISDEALAAFLRLCPSLQYFDISIFLPSNQFLKIDCPSLTHLVFTCLGRTYFTIVNSPNLREVKIRCPLEILLCVPITNIHIQHLDLDVCGKITSKYLMADIIQKMALVHCHSLRVSDAVMKALRVGVNNDGLFLPHLKHICVTVDILDHYMLSKLRILLSCCLALEKLSIFYGKQNLDEDSPVGLLDLRQLNNGVKFTCYQGKAPYHTVMQRLPETAYML